MSKVALFEKEMTSLIWHLCKKSSLCKKFGIKLLFNPSHVLVLMCSNKYILGWLVGFCNTIFFLGLVGNTSWQKEITTRNFVFCNLSYATKKCRMQLHMLHATPK
jgi:hypothetical protein